MYILVLTQHSFGDLFNIASTCDSFFMSFCDYKVKKRTENANPCVVGFDLML